MYIHYRMKLVILNTEQRNLIVYIIESKSLQKVRVTQIVI